MVDTTKKFPVMPDNWWPEGGIVVMGKNGKHELGFAITKETYEDGLCSAQIDPCLRALIRCLWQEQHIPLVKEQV